MISKITIARSVENAGFFFRLLSLVCRAKYQGRKYLCLGGVVKSHNFYQTCYSKKIWNLTTKCDNLLLHSVTAEFITECDNLLLQSATAILLQSATSAITKCDRYYKVWEFYYKVRYVLQSATIITKCDRTGFHPPHLIPRWGYKLASTFKS